MREAPVNESEQNPVTDVHGQCEQKNHGYGHVDQGGEQVAEISLVQLQLARFL